MSHLPPLSLRAGDPDPSPQVLLMYEQETSRLLREKGMCVEAQAARLREGIECALACLPDEPNVAANALRFALADEERGG